MEKKNHPHRVEGRDPTRKVRVVCIDDQDESRQLLIHHLEPLRAQVDLYDFATTEDAFLMMEHIYEECTLVKRNLLERYRKRISKKNLVIPSPFGLIISNHIIPKNKSGIDFLRELYWDIRYQEAIRLLITGSPPNAAFRRLLKDAKVDYVINKPWNQQTLVEVVQQAINDYWGGVGLESTIPAAKSKPQRRELSVQKA